MEQQELDSLIDKANDIIEDYYNHRSSTINLWITYAPIPGNYVICVENVHTGYKMLENTDLKLSVFQHFFILVSY